MIQQNQFGGVATEDLHAYLAKFIQICDTFKLNRVLDEVMRL